MKESVLKGVVSAALAGLTAYFGEIAIPLVVLLFAMVADYATGMLKAWVTKELNSRIGIVGIVKKLCYLFIVCVGMIVDYLINSALVQMNITFQPQMIFGLIVTIWLIINELISILENVSIVRGVPNPKFLTKIIARLKITVENSVDTDDKEDTKNE